MSKALMATCALAASTMALSSFGSAAAAPAGLPVDGAKPQPAAESAIPVNYRRHYYRRYYHGYYPPVTYYRPRPVYRYVAPPVYYYPPPVAYSYYWAPPYYNYYSDYYYSDAYSYYDPWNAPFYAGW